MNLRRARFVPPTHMDAGASAFYLAETVMPLAPLPWIFINLDGAVAWILAVAAPIVIMVVWRLGLSPRARFAWPAPLRWALQLIVLALGPVALFAVGWNRIAWALLILTTVGAVIIRLWEPPRRADPT